MPPITIPPALAKQWGVTGQPARDNPVRYLVLRSFCVGAGVDLRAGEEVTLPRRQAVGWVSTGKLRALGPDTAELESRDPSLEHGDEEVETRTPRGRRK